MKDNIMTLPYKEPSQVLMGLLNQIVDEGRRFASAADMKVSDMSSQSPVGTTLAILERTLKVMSAVQARIHYSMKREFKLLRDIIRDYTPDSYDYEPGEGKRMAKQADYDMCDVIPVSDPNAATMSQKVVQYQAAMQLAQQAPQLYDLPLLHRQMLAVLGIKHAEKLVKMEEDQKPVDPVSENMAVLQGKPVKAFIYQDHQAHIQVHTAAMQDPMIMQTMGQNPMAQAIMGAAQAHIAEHVAFEYRKQIEEQLGVPYPAPDEEMSEEMEVQISRLAAAAAQKVLQNSKSQAAQVQAEQAQQDPIVQMQQQELQMKQQEVQIAQQDQALKAQRLQMDAIAAADKQELEEKRLEFDIQLAGVKLGSEIKNKEKKMQMDALSAADKQELGEAKAHLDAQVKGVQLGHQISSAHKAGMNPKIPGKA
jgi:hypothetical protein